MAASDVTIGRLERRHLGEATQLYRLAFGMSERESLPAWLMMTTERHGGVSLGAFAADELIGLSYAFAAFDHSEPYLYSCGLVVREAFRGRRVGLRLKLAQRNAALEAGYRRSRWTTGSQNVPALSLYLNRLGARVIGIVPDMLDGLVASAEADEVELEWDLIRPAGPRPVPSAAIAVDLDGPRADARRAIQSALADGRCGIALRSDPKTRTARALFAC
jgi:predicted GNAT superfamily acetyltransferase